MHTLHPYTQHTHTHTQHTHTQHTHTQHTHTDVTWQLDWLDTSTRLSIMQILLVHVTSWLRIPLLQLVVGLNWCVGQDLYMIWHSFALTIHLGVDLNSISHQYQKLSISPLKRSDMDGYGGSRFPALICPLL